MSNAEIEVTAALEKVLSAAKGEGRTMERTVLKLTSKKRDLESECDMAKQRILSLEAELAEHEGVLEPLGGDSLTLHAATQIKAEHEAFEAADPFKRQRLMPKKSLNEFYIEVLSQLGFAPGDIACAAWKTSKRSARVMYSFVRVLAKPVSQMPTAVHVEIVVKFGSGVKTAAFEAVDVRQQSLVKLTEENSASMADSVFADSNLDMLFTYDRKVSSTGLAKDPYKVEVIMQSTFALSDLNMPFDPKYLDAQAMFNKGGMSTAEGAGLLVRIRDGAAGGLSSEGGSTSDATSVTDAASQADDASGNNAPPGNLDLLFNAALGMTTTVEDVD
jgi:hypothetical protein